MSERGIQGHEAGGTADGPAVIVLLNKNVGGLPDYDDPRAMLGPVSEILTERFSTDVHFAAYASDVSRRLKVVLVRDPNHADTLAGAAPRMMLAVFDVDDRVAHEQHIPAREEWREENRHKIRALLAEHPGGFVAESRGGYRIVYALPQARPIRSREDENAWKADYESWVRYLTRRFGIHADDACKDWPRLYRAPFVVRDGVKQEPAVIGDPAALGVWSPELTAEDRVAPRKVRKTGDRRKGMVYGAVTPVPIPDARNAYGRTRLADALRYLQKARLVCFATSGQRPSRRDAMFTIAVYLIQRLRLPVNIAADCIEHVYNPRLVAAGLTPWSREEPGDYGMSIVERLEQARDTATDVPPGDIWDQETWSQMVGVSL